MIYVPIYRILNQQLQLRNKDYQNCELLLPLKLRSSHTRARKIGSRYMVNLDIEVDPEMTVREAHEIAKEVENIIKKDIANVYDVMVHVEPTGNLEIDEKFGVTEKDVPLRRKKK